MTCQLATKPSPPLRERGEARAREGETQASRVCSGTGIRDAEDERNGGNDEQASCCEAF